MNNLKSSIFRLLFCLLLLFDFYTFASNKAKYSNVIFFGDSQTDIGNLPETNLLKVNAKKNSPEARLTALSYVPDSSPVDISLSNKEYQVIIPDKKGKLKTVRRKYPDISAFDQILGLQPLLNGLKRTARSLGWSQYFIKIMHNEGLLESNTIKPWFRVYEDKGSNIKFTSVNYAVISAQSHKDGRYVLYFKPEFKDKVFPAITGSKSSEYIVYKTMKNFRNNPGNPDLINKVVVPGTRLQKEKVEQLKKSIRISI